MAFPDPKTPTRDQLYKVFNDHNLVRLFEKLFQSAGDLIPTQVSANTINIAANEVRISTNETNIADNETRSKSNEVMTWISM